VPEVDLLQFGEVESVDPARKSRNAHKVGVMADHRHSVR